MLAGKKIILGVCGSISAYKAPILVRLLRAEGADVRVVLTPSATQFVSAVTLATLSGYDVACKWIRPDSDLWFNHVEWGLWADLILIAPASASSISRFVQGDAPFFLDGVYLSARCPIAMAPAMDHDMWIHPATQTNINTLLQRGNIIIQPDEGELASGLVGKGRLPEPEFLLEWTKQFFNCQKLRGINILITSGPTREPLDPVRFLSNHSTGTMGKEMAYAAARQGANVFFVSGPVEQYPEHQNIQVIRVETAMEMKAEVDKRKNVVNWFICAAAVADFRPALFSKEKIKKQEEGHSKTLELIKNPDILSSIGRDKQAGQLVVGFALETNAADENARMKLERKNADIICLNLYSSDGRTGFGNKTNAFTVYSRNDNIVRLGMADKKILAAELISFFFDYAQALK